MTSQRKLLVIDPLIVGELVLVAAARALGVIEIDRVGALITSRHDVGC